MNYIKVDPELFADLLADRERLRRLVTKAARIMRRDGFTALRGTLWYDGEGVEDIQAEDTSLARLDGVSIRDVLCRGCGHVEHYPGDCGNKRLAFDCGCSSGVHEPGVRSARQREDRRILSALDKAEEIEAYPLTESDVHEGDL
jgi:hypothetical protein